jgi:hypothetical protein
MTGNDSALELFFRDYAVASVESPVEQIPPFYADNFIASGPRGSAVFKNDERFLEWLGQVHQFNQRIGMVSMEVVSVEERVSLSSRHILVSVEWGARFTKTGDRLITFRIAYLMEKAEDKWRILAYVSEKDQEDEMQESGLL